MSFIDLANTAKQLNLVEADLQKQQELAKQKLKKDERIKAISNFTILLTELHDEGWKDTAEIDGESRVTYDINGQHVYFCLASDNQTINVRGLPYSSTVLNLAKVGSFQLSDSKEKINEEITKSFRKLFS